MAISPKSLGIVAIVVGLYGLFPSFPESNWIAAIGAIVVGILLMLK